MASNSQRHLDRGWYLLPVLRRLAVDNLAVIGHAELGLEAGLTAITGETGAGKTMLAQAVSLMSGQKADSSLVGPDGDEAYVEAEFDDPIPEALAAVADPDDALILARRLRSGSSRALCGGRSCSAEQLKEAASALIAITGQGAARRLASPQAQLALVDAKGSLDGLRDETGVAYKRLREAEGALARAREGGTELARRMEMLRHELDLVRSLDPQEGEERSLGDEHGRLANAEALGTTAAASSEALSGDDGLADQLARVQRELEGASEHDANMGRLAAELEGAVAAVREVASAAQDLADGYEADPARLEAIGDRLEALRDLRRRFGGKEVAGILAQAQQDEDELEGIDVSEERMAELEAERERAESSYTDVAMRLRKSRRKAATSMAKEAHGHLAELGLGEAHLHVEWQETEPGEGGSDRVHILLQANAGLEATPLDKGASGGELSRVSLALLLASGSHRGTWIFDEVDAGIGGQTAHVVAAKLKALSSLCQVITITHLAQIAVQADHHFVIHKEAGRACVVELSSDEEREVELARLMGTGAEDAQEAASLMRAAAGQGA
jgi:DNA repair protein RecN (Recombination protein N)